MAQFTVGRFFFVHESRATHDNRQLRTYEFLHTTFGEFLVAHLVVRVLTDMLTSETAPGLSRPDGADSGILHALLSFAALTARTPVVAFVGDLFDQLGAQPRAAIADLLLRLHIRALFPVSESAFSHYEPLALTVTARHAAWSANLVVLSVLAAGEITGTQLFPDAPDPGGAWRGEAMIWRSQLAGYGWEGLHETIALNRVWNGQRREILLHRRSERLIPDPIDMSWVFDISSGPEVRKGISSFQAHDPLLSRRKINFACNMAEDIMSHSLGPSISSFPVTANVFVILGDGRTVSAINALLSAFYLPYQEGAPAGPAYLDLAHVARELARAPNAEDHYPYLKAALDVLISAVEQGAAPPASLEPLTGLTSATTKGDTKLTKLIARLQSLLTGHQIVGNAAPDNDN